MSSYRADVGHLLALLAHELRSPTTVLAGSLRLLLDGRLGPLTDAQRALLRPADSSSRRLIALLDDLSELGRLSRGEASFGRARLSIAGTAARAAEAFVPMAEATVRVEVRIDPDGYVFADAGRLARVITALCQASARGLGVAGTVVVSRADAADRQTLHLVVEPGLGPGVIERLGDVGDPVDAFEGVGFELPIARAVLAAEGGSLSVAADRMTVRLPLTAASESA